MGHSGRDRIAWAVLDPKIKAYIREQVGSIISTLAESVLHERARTHRQFEKVREEIETLRSAQSFKVKLGRVRIKDK